MLEDEDEIPVKGCGAAGVLHKKLLEDTAAVQMDEYEDELTDLPTVWRRPSC
ncbi:MAG: hypothetical protein ACLTJG_09835 [[Clostridium] innocuum]